MPINFNGINPNTSGSLRPKTEDAAQSQQVAKNQAAVQNETAVKQSSDQVSFSSQARDLKQLENAVRSMPEVDQERVARIKAALAEGSYKVDPEKLAGKLLSFEEETK